MKRGWGCCCLAALLVSPAALANDAQTWLHRMSDATSQVSYTGAFVYERSGSFSTHQVWHRATDESVTERLLQADGEPLEWVRRDGHVQCATSYSAGPLWDTSTEAAQDPAMLEQWYSLEVLGGTRVADRAATVVAVKPRDNYRYAYELYLDNETGLLLKSLLINERSTLLERFQFTNLSYSDISDASLEPGPGCLQLDATLKSEGADSEAWEPGWLPPGFVAGPQDIRSFAVDESPVSSRVYTDGMSRFTVFVESLGEEGLADDLRAQLGPTVAVSRKLKASNGVFLATVVGEIPPAAAERIASSFAQPAEPASD
ncbi:MucB/RseB C-terminal domain-containing protein [Halopseudomonas sp.]|uniref:MucB/RseB C-terminal domain-containing protein n=1 Tax=Halopseudomonas sp. TaxID=2901191 RepID=UPI003FA58FA5